MGDSVRNGIRKVVFRRPSFVRVGIFGLLPLRLCWTAIGNVLQRPNSVGS
jgi:hypothetical protein